MATTLLPRVFLIVLGLCLLVAPAFGLGFAHGQHAAQDKDGGVMVQVKNPAVALQFEAPEDATAVQFSIDGYPTVFTDTELPFSMNFAGLAPVQNGLYTIRGVAKDGNGNPLFEDVLFAEVVLEPHDRSPPVTLSTRGDPVTVFDKSRMGCPYDPYTLADGPLDVFRDSSGMIKAALPSDPVSRYLVFDPATLEFYMDCDPVWEAQRDPTPNAYRWAQWLISVNCDGASCVGMLHNEQYGNVIDPTCRDAHNMWSWTNGLGIVTSHDGGATWVPQEGLLTAVPAWQMGVFPCSEHNRTVYGTFGGYSLRVGPWVYVLFLSVADPGNNLMTGTCVARILASDPALKQVYDGIGWNKNPHAVCAPIMDNVTRSMHTSLHHFNDLGLLMLLGVVNVPDGTARFAVSFARVDDPLTSWSEPQVLPIEARNAAGCWIRAYPSLVDLRDASQNMDAPSATGELYLTFTHNKGCEGSDSLDRDVQAVRVEFVSS